jgi:hypothetical protein
MDASPLRGTENSLAQHKSGSKGAVFERSDLQMLPRLVPLPTLLVRAHQWTQQTGVNPPHSRTANWSCPKPDRQRGDEHHIVCC